MFGRGKCRPGIGTGVCRRGPSRPGIGTREGEGEGWIERQREGGRGEDCETSPASNFMVLVPNKPYSSLRRHPSPRPSAGRSHYRRVSVAGEQRWQRVAKRYGNALRRRTRAARRWCRSQSTRSLRSRTAANQARAGGRAGGRRRRRQRGTNTCA